VRRKKRQMPMKNYRRWSEDEKAIIKKHYGAIGNRDLTQAFDDRSPRSIGSMARRLGCLKNEDRRKEANSANGQIKHPPEPDSAA